MKYSKIPILVLLALIATSAAGPPRANAQAPVLQNQANQSSALERGYRTGYSDGYSAGSRDLVDHAARDYRNNDDYQRGDRSYNQEWGTLEDYSDGYRQGFEVGYTAGYDRLPFESSIPTGLSRRGDASPASANNSPVDTGQSPGQNPGQNGNPAQNTNQGAPPDNSSDAAQPASGVTTGPLSLPRNAILLIELQSSLSTDASQRGDRFQARVIDPRDFAGAIVEGLLTIVKRPGKVKGTAEMQLSFETLRLPDGRSVAIKADVVEIVDMGNRDGAGTVDSEGGVKGRDSTKDDVSKVGAGAGIGAIIGAIFGGGKGAAIGAVIGGGVGTGAVLTKRGQDVRLERGQQLRIRTATEARIE